MKEQITQGSNLTLTDQILGYNVINDAFFDEISDVSRKKPYMVGVGKHEANCINGNYGGYTESICAAGLTNFTEYKARRNMPGDGSGSNNFWYSFGGCHRSVEVCAKAHVFSEVGMTHYLIFDTETDRPAPYIGADVLGGTEGMAEANVGSFEMAQVDFIKQDLAAVDRSRTPLAVAMGHRPWYTDCGRACQAIQSWSRRF